MKLDILNCVNTDRLDYAIHEIGKERIAYLVMSTKTHVDISVLNHDIGYIGPGGKAYHKYKGIKVALFDGLPYGEVDIVAEIEKPLFID